MYVGIHVCMYIDRHSSGYACVFLFICYIYVICYMARIAQLVEKWTVI